MIVNLEDPIFDMTNIQRKISIIPISIVVIIVGLIGFNGSHDYILIQSDYSNTAVKIERRLTILNLSQKLRLNLKFRHACGYQTTIKMINNHKITSLMPFNLECEEFLRATGSINKEIRAYHKRSIENPTHKIFNLIIPVKYEVDSILNVLKRENIDYVLLDGNLNQFPIAKISTIQMSKRFDTQDRKQWNIEDKENEDLAKKKIKEIIEQIKRKYPVEKVGKISNPIGAFSSIIQHEMEVDLYFNIGSDLSTFREFIESIGGEVEDIKIPTTFWIPILIDVRDDVSEKIENLDFVLKTVEYPNHQ